MPTDRILLQIREDTTEVLYELSIPPGPDAGRWRLLADTNRDGRLSEAELAALARLVGEHMRARISLRLEENALPLALVDAKLADVATPDGLTGRLSAIALLSTRALPPGLRKLEVAVDPLANRAAPALVRVESTAGEVKSLVGGRRATLDGGVPGVLLSKGDSATLLVDVARPRGK